MNELSLKGTSKSTIAKSTINYVIFFVADSMYKAP